MNFFFDNCVSPVLAATIHGYVSGSRDQAVHIKDGEQAGLAVTRSSSDVEWITALGEAHDDWIVVTADQRIKKNRAEREAFRRSGLKGLVLAPAYQNMSINQQASALLWRWPELVDVIGRFYPPTLIGVPQTKSGKLSPLQW